MSHANKLCSIVVIMTLAAAHLMSAFAEATADKSQGKPAVINVTVQYKGKSQVTEKTPIWVFVFNTPTPVGIPPIDAKPLAKNGGVVQFDYAGTEPVYVLVALDQQGGYNGLQAPPRAGSPIGSYSIDAKTPAPIKVTPVTNVKIVFDDTVVFKQ